MCRRGEFNLCQRFDQGTLAPGMLTGFCRDTGGSWSAEFVAHRSQLLAVPEQLSDEEAVLAEPFAVSLHAVLRNLPDPDDTVLVIGGGVVGLCAIAALRGVGVRSRIVALARHAFQAEAAQRLGADVVLGRTRGKALQRKLVDTFDASALKPVLGPDVVVGGADIVFDCVGSSSSLSDALRYAGSGGRLVVIGLAGTPNGIDWTPVWLNELTIRGAFTYAQEKFEGESISTMALALRLLAEKRVDLCGLVNHRFALADYRDALETVTSKDSSGVIKAVFAFDPPDATTSAPVG
jgi:threonine dehydrogenase-like Zn-dependent dehydrogenase